MAYKDEEEKRRKAQERKAAGLQYQEKRDELLKKNAELNASKKATPKPSATAMASGKSKTSMTAEKVSTSVAGYAKKNEGDNDMSKVVAGYNKEKPDINNMTYEQAMGFATRIVYDDERDAFLSRWQKSAKKKNGSAPTMDEMRTHLNSQKPGGLYRESKDSYSKQVKENFKNDYTNMKTMHAFDGLLDISGNAVNMNTASLEEIERAIRFTANDKKRNALVSALETLTKTPGNRFYGVTFDKSNTGEFLESSEMSKDGYDYKMEYFRGQFDPIAGAGEANTAAYQELLKGIEESDNSDYVKRQFKDALDEVYTELIGGEIPKPQASNAPQELQEAEEAPQKAAQEDKEDWLSKALSWGKEALDGFRENKAILTAGEFQFAKQMDKPEEIKTGEWQGPKQRKAPTLQDALADEEFMRSFIETKMAEAEAEGISVGEWQGAQFKDVLERSIADEEFQAHYAQYLEDKNKPKEVQGPVRPPMLGAEEDNKLPSLYDTLVEKYGAPNAKPGMGGDVQASGSVDLTHDLGKAWFEYKETGRFDELTPETQKMLSELYGEDGVKAWMGILGDSEFSQFAARNEDGTTGQELNNVPPEFLYTQNVGKLGANLTKIASAIYDEEFPAELREDAFMAGIQLIQEANDWAASEVFLQEVGEKNKDLVNIYDEYQRLHGRESKAAVALSDAIALSAKMKNDEREAQMLSVEEAHRNERQNLLIARKAVISGLYTPEQMELVEKYAPVMDEAARMADPLYKSMMDQMLEEWEFGSNEWMDEQVLSMAEALGGEYTAQTDMDWAARVVAYDFLEDVLRKKTDVAYALGYRSLEAYAYSHGGLTLESLQTEARLEMLKLGSLLDSVDMAISNEAVKAASQYTGSGEGVTAGQIAGAALASGTLSAVGDPIEGFYNWMAATDLKRDGARVKATYDNDYGLFSETQLKSDLNAMADGGYFPNDEMAQFVKEYLKAGGNPYELGLMPDDLQFVRKSAVSIKQTRQAYGRWANRMLNPKQGMAFEAGSAVADNTTRMVLGAITRKAVGGTLLNLGGKINPALIGTEQLAKRVGDVSGFTSMLVTYGSSSYNEGASSIYAQDAQAIKETGKIPKNTQRWANVMGISQAVATAASEYVTFGKWADNVGRLFGVNSAVKFGMNDIGMSGAMRVWAGVTKFTKAFAGQELDEFKDELVEGYLKDAVDIAVTDLRSTAGTPMDALFSSLKGAVGAMAKADDTLKATFDNAAMIALTTAPMAILGAGGAMKDAMPRTYSAAKQMANGGKAEDTKRFITAMMDEVGNATPEQMDAANRALHDAAVAEEAVVILTSDPEIEPTNKIGVKAQEQADAHAKSEENSIAAAEAGRASALAAQERLIAKEGNPDENLTQIANGVEAHAKNSQSVLEHRREKNQKQAEADAAFAKGMKKAAAKAEAEVSAREAAIANPPQEQIDPAHNARVMEVNQYIEENYPDGVDDSTWQEIYNDFLADDGETVSAEEATPESKLSKANAEFAAQISKKFGANIQFGDLAGAEGAYSRKADTIYLDPNATQGEVIKRVMVHELTHRTEGTEAYKELESALIELKYGKDAAQFNADIESKRRQYQSRLAEMGRTGEFDEAAARKEIIADICSELISGNDEAIARLVAEKPSVARQILNAIKDFIDKLRGVKDPEVENLRRIERLLESGLKEVDNGDTQGLPDDVQFALKWTKDGKRYVEIEEDILAGEPEEKWAKIAHEALKKFASGIPVGRRKIYVSKKSRGEWTNASDTRRLKREEPDVYKDKLSASGNADEILWASTNYVNEEAGHNRVDGIGDFARGEVLLSIGGRDYRANVIVAKRADGELILYDVTHIAPGKIQKKRPQNENGSRKSVPIRQSAAFDTSVAENVPVVNMEDAQMSLPSAAYRKQEIAAWRKAKRAETQREEEGRKGERQFVSKTLQNSRAIPSYIRQTLFNDPTSRFYERDTNDEQIIRAYQTIAQEGKEAAIERILTNRELPTKDEVAQANVLMAMAAHDGDMSTLLALSRHYAEDTTEVAQAFQAMKIFKRMTPAGAMSAAAAQNEALLSGYIEGHAPVRQEVEAEARRVSEDIEGKDSRDPIALLGSGETTLTRENSKWGIPINERQEALIKHYKLENVTRPGIHYNRATIKQRMLEAILATPDPLEATNEGMTLVTRLEYMKKGAPVVTNADLQYIGRQLSIFTYLDADAQESREGQLALARAYEANANISPVALSEKINGARFIGMLLNLTSPMRNVMGNVLQTAENTTANALATVLDYGISLATKKHTKAFNTPGEMVRGWEAFVQETADTYRDYFVDQAIVKQGEGRFDVNRRGRVYRGKAAETARVLESFLMSVGDRNFWKMAYVNSMNEQMRVAKMNGVELDYDAAHERAEQEANYATFNEDNAVRDVFARFKRAGAVGKIVDLLMPFTGVPTNIIKRQLEYGPIGLAYTSIKHAVRAANKQTFDQKAFVEELARGLTGTGLMALGFGLRQLGMIIGGTVEEEDTEAYYMRTARGEQYTPFIKWGDQYISLSTFAPAVSPILMGATAYDAWKNDEDLVQAFADATAASLDSIIDASYFSSLQDILTGDGTFAENLEEALLTSVATQSTPSLMSQFASYLDPYVRDTKDKNWMIQALNKAKNRIPGLRETLPIKYDVTGEPVMNTKEGWRAFLDPFSTTVAEDDAAVDELMALYERTDDKKALTSYLISSNSYSLSITNTMAKATGTGKEGYKLELTADQKKEVNRMYGDMLFNGDGRSVDGLRDLIGSNRWERMDDEERIEEISEMKSQVKETVVKWAIEQYGKGE